MIKYYEFESFAGKLLPPLHVFSTEKNIFKIVFGQNFFNFQPIFKMFAAHFRKY